MRMFVEESRRLAGKEAIDQRDAPIFEGLGNIGIQVVGSGISHVVVLGIRSTLSTKQPTCHWANKLQQHDFI